MNKLTNNQFINIVEKNLSKKHTFKNDLKAVGCLYKLMKTSNSEYEQNILNKVMNKYVSMHDLYDYAKATNQTNSIKNKTIIMSCSQMTLSTLRALEYLCQDAVKQDNYIKDSYWGSLANDVRSFEQTK